MGDSWHNRELTHFDVVGEMLSIGVISPVEYPRRSRQICCGIDHQRKFPPSLASSPDRWSVNISFDFGHVKHFSAFDPLPPATPAASLLLRSPSKRRIFTFDEVAGTH